VTTIEQELGRAIEAATGAVPEAGPDFFAAVTARTERRRRRQRRGAAAALVVAVAAGVGVVAVAVPDRRTSTVEPTPPAPSSASAEPAVPPAVGPDRVPDFQKAADAAKVWPAAVVRLSRTLPNGARYVVQSVLPGGRYLVLQWRLEGAGFTLEHPSIYEPATNSVRRLTDPSAVVGFTIAGVSGDKAVWVTSDPVTFAHEIWAAPLAGGPARRLIRLPHIAPDRSFVNGFTLVGDSVMWHAEREVVREGTKVGQHLGIFRIPVAGGSVKSVPNTVGFQFTYDYSGFGGVAIAQRGNYTGGGGAGELLDLATGKRSTWTRAEGGVDMWPLVSCSPVACIGLGNTGGIAPIVWRPDGSALLKLGLVGLNPLADGRFLRVAFRSAGAQESTLAVWDRATGQVGVCSPPPARDAILPMADLVRGRPFQMWETDDALMLIDLTKIT
jgi:hypothetical protein